MSSNKFSCVNILIVKILIAIVAVLEPVNGDEIIVQPPDVTKDKEVICDAVQRGDVDIKVDIDGMMDYDDLLRLTVWNNKYNLRSGEKMFQFQPEVNWKRSIIARLGTIFTKTCPNEFVDPQFLNAVIELFMIYQNSFKESFNHTTAWNELTPILDLCIANGKKMDMIASGYDLTGMNVAVVNGTTQEIAILPPEEVADSSQDIDVIIDTIWWLFSFSIGNCYWSAENPSHWAARYKRLFYADFLTPLKKRWLHAGPNTEFGVIFGDFSFETIIKNIRVCVTAAYTSQGLADRQLVRSITLAAPGLGIEAGLNKKIGKTL